MDKNIKNQKKWSSRDWIWLVGILIAIIVFILTFRLGDNLQVINLFSFISSSVSIALAVVAIFIALKQDSDNKQVNDRMVDLLNKIKTGVKNVDSKLPSLINSVGEETAQFYSEKIGKQDTYTRDQVDEIIDGFRKDITLNVNDLLTQERNKEIHKLRSWNNRVHNALENESEIEQERIRARVFQIIRDNMDKNLEEIQTIIESETGYRYAIVLISNYRHRIVQEEVS